MPTAKPASEAATNPRVRGERILLVDDQLNVARASALVFEQLGFRTAVFTDPREALQAFADAPETFDVVMTDLTMPVMNGSQLARALHALRPDVGVIVTSGRDLSDEDRRDLGKHSVLKKPWRIEDAISAMRMLLDQP